MLERVREQLVENDRHRARRARRDGGVADDLELRSARGAEDVEDAVRDRLRERRERGSARARRQHVLERRHAAQSADGDVERIGERALGRPMSLHHEERLNGRQIVPHAMLELAKEERRRFGLATRPLVEAAVFRCQRGERAIEAHELALGAPNSHELLDAGDDVAAARARSDPCVGGMLFFGEPRWTRQQRNDRQERNLVAGLEATTERQRLAARQGENHRLGIRHQRVDRCIL